MLPRVSSRGRWGWQPDPGQHGMHAARRPAPGEPRPRRRRRRRSSSGTAPADPSARVKHVAAGTTHSDGFSRSCGEGAAELHAASATATLPTPVPPTIEQRVFYRLTIELPLRYQLVTPARRASSEHGSCLNLSAGGMLLRTRSLDETIGDDLLTGRGHVVIAMQLPGAAEELRITARALWMEDDGDATRIGVRFLDLAPAAQESVQQFVLRHSLG